MPKLKEKDEEEKVLHQDKARDEGKETRSETERESVRLRAGEKSEGIAIIPVRRHGCQELRWLSVCPGQASST